MKTPATRALSYRHLLTVLGLALIALGFLERGWMWVAVWMGIDFLLLAIAHSRGAHRVFGKRSDGTLPVWSWIVFLPLLVYIHVVWHLLRLLSREPSYHQINEKLVVGRRLLPHEWPGEFTNYIDLTAEFAEPARIRRAPGYHSFPILDGAAPDPGELGKQLARIKPGKTFIHCAQGHGRSGLFALAVLLRSGAVGSVEEGLQMLGRSRSGICLNTAQRRCIDQFASVLL